jgi:hydrogenase nickel incorporation protein HypA/HybF
MLDIALDNAYSNGANQIHLLRLRVGAISGIVPSALYFAFDACKEGTIATNAELQIEWVQAICYCSQCHADFAPHDWVYICPRCDRISHEIRQGRELQLISLEIS